MLEADAIPLCLWYPGELDLGRLVAFTAIFVLSQSGAMVPKPAAAGTGQSAAGDPAAAQRDVPGDVVIVGRPMGSAVGDVDPVAVLDRDAIRAIGATSLKALIERLKPLTASTDGSEPVYLLNGRRISGPSEMENLPPEAIDRIEVLPESEAARFGLPPTVRVSNFVTKRRFRAVTLQELGGTTTEGGGGTNYVELNSTRIDGPRRMSMSLSHLRLNPILQCERDIVADPDELYSTGGTVTGVDGMSIDPALNALAGRAVRVAALPGDAGDRRTLAGYLVGANGSTAGRVGAYRSLRQPGDTVDASVTVASPIGTSLDGSLNLSIEAQAGSGLDGLAPALLRVPAGSGFLPFGTNVLVYRYLPDVVLRQRSSSLDLHAGGTLQGGVRRWSWNVAGAYDRLRSRGRSDRGVPLDALQRAVSVGADPLSPIDADSAARRLVDSSDTTTGTLVTRAVATGPLMRLPAGDAQMTVSAEYARSTSSGDRASIVGEPFAFARATRTVSVGANVPIAAPGHRLLPVPGRLAINGTIGGSDVSGYGRLANYSYGATWTPFRSVQISAAISDALTPPGIELLTGATLTTPNTPFFDFATGDSVLVTSLTGGRPELLPERRRRSQFGVVVTPIRDKELRFSVDYVVTRFTNGTEALGSATSALQSAFPDVFVRDSTGRLASVDLRPVNLASEYRRQLRMVFSLSTPVGRARPTTPATASGDASVASSRRRVPATMSAVVTTRVRLDDRLTLRPGTVPLDLLDGATLTGTGGQPRWETDVDVRGSVGALSLGLYGRLRGATRVRGDAARSDLFFSGLTWLVPYGSLDVSKVVGRPWARDMTLQLTVENLLNDRVDVRDRTGMTPSRFQSAYLDPVGRSIRLGARKSF